MRNNKGFTIIEVMIVLAIAGLIILVVLLAVPALQRNSRNTAIKNDASAMAASISEFEGNNNGAGPTKALWQSDGWQLQNATITTGGLVKLQGSTTLNGTAGAAGATATFKNKIQPVAADVSAGAIYIDYGEGCQSVSGTTPTVNARAYAIYYWTETPKVAAGADATTGVINGVGLKGQCLES